MALFWPIAKQSIRFGPQEAHPGADLKLPPTLSQPLNLEPSQYMCHMASSWPIPKTSRRLLPQEDTPVPCLKPPPTSSQPLQPAASTERKLPIKSTKVPIACKDPFLFMFMRISPLLLSLSASSISRSISLEIGRASFVTLRNAQGMADGRVTQTNRTGAR